ncbi:hypothetical protein [Clavibacter sp. 199]|jgi:hypothetical protein|uniref:hypothetical protein n=1 Tax=Clavibacter nebraskensis TaxID=31963 RepID=UPI000E24084A
MTSLLEDTPRWLLYAGLAAMLLVHMFVLSNRRHAWPGAVFPVAWVVLFAVLAGTGQPIGPREILSGAIVLGLLVFLWVSMRRSRAARVARVRERPAGEAD